MTAPVTRTHSVAEAEKFGGFRYLRCRDCGTWFDLDDDRQAIEQQPCRTRSDPESEAHP